MSDVIFKKHINLFFLKNKDAFYEAEFHVEISNFNRKILNIDSIPSDLVENLKKVNLKKPMEISLIQGQHELFNKMSFNEYKNIDKKFKRNNNIRFTGVNGFLDYFFDSVGTNLVYSQELINTQENTNRLNRLLDNFAENFKIPKFYLTDLTNAIRFQLNEDDLIYIHDSQEKPCIDNLEGIKRLFPSNQWEIIKAMINYQSFVDAEFKTIKYTFSSRNNNLILNFKVAHYIETSNFFKFYENKYELLNEIQINTFTLNEVASNQLQELNYLRSEIDITSDSTIGSKELTNNNENYSISSQRRLKGSPFGFDNFELSHEVLIRPSTQNTNKKLALRIVDLIPEQFDVLFSTLKIHYEIYNQKGDVNTFYFFDSKNYKHFLKMSFNITEMQHPVLWTYDKKRKVYVNFEEIYLLPNSRLKISYELRKRLLNFESFDNEFEFGYKIPSGIMIYSFEKAEEYLYVTDQIYFNIPTIDNTMPFNIIALTAVVFGVFLIQTLNMFIGDKSKSWITRIKEKFSSLFGKKQEKIKVD
jgi:hypothetical protein